MLRWLTPYYVVLCPVIDLHRKHCKKLPSSLPPMDSDVLTATINKHPLVLLVSACFWVVRKRKYWEILLSCNTEYSDSLVALLVQASCSFHHNRHSQVYLFHSIIFHDFNGTHIPIRYAPILILSSLGFGTSPSSLFALRLP